jgi:N utilization substance protein A
LEVLIPNALQPAEVEQVILCKMLGRAIVLVREDQLSLAIGRRGQNVRLASKLSGWDIEIMTQEELAESIERAIAGYRSLAGVEAELADKLVEEGFLSYDDLSIIEPDELMAMGNLSEEQVAAIVEQAEGLAEQAEIAAAEARRQKREQERIAELKGESSDETAEAGESAESDESSDADETSEGEAEESDAVAAEESSTGPDAQEEESDEAAMLDASHAAPEGKE